MRFAARLHSGRFLHPLLRRLTARRSLCFLSPPGPFARNGLSLASNGCSFSKPPSQGQRSRPATSLSSESLPRPVRPSRSTTNSGLPDFGCFSASGPLPLLPLRSVPLRPLPLPVGALTPLRINASADPATRWTAFSFGPISLRSPQPYSIARLPSHC